VKYKRGDKHPSEDLYFYQNKKIRGKYKELWLTKDKLEYQQKRHLERARERYKRTARKEPKEVFKRGDKNAETGLVFFSNYRNRNQYWISEEKYNEKKEQAREYRKNYSYHKDRYHKDPIFKLKILMKGRLRSILLNPNNPLKKSKRTFEYIGCSAEQLKKHLEDQFSEGMTWDNYGTWHVDHKTPTSRASTEEELMKLCHYTNLQPLWEKDNLCKGKLTAEEWDVKKEKIENSKIFIEDGNDILD